MSAWVERFALGAADGPTIAIKDSIDIAGMPTRAGSRALEEILPAIQHADAVRAVLDAGWNITGKTTMHELAYGMTGVNAWAGTPLNPQDAARIPGGSSSGSAAAVGNGEVDAALGTDTGGSIRVPAACCGVIGLKPTFGRVSRRGAWPRATSLDCAGPFSRDIATLNKVMAAIAPGFDLALAGRPQASARIAVLRTGSDAAILSALDNALAATGWQLKEHTLGGMQAAFEAGLTVINRETWNAFGHLTATGRVGDDVARRLELASATTDEQLAHAEQVRRDFSAEVDAALEHADALVLPTLPTLPPTLADVASGVSVVAISTLVRPFNLSGHPALSFPIPVAGTAVRAGLQLVGRKGDDERLCALALHLQQVLQVPQR
jgi:amidase